MLCAKGIAQNAATTTRINERRFINALNKLSNEVGCKVVVHLLVKDKFEQSEQSSVVYLFWSISFRFGLY